MTHRFHTARREGRGTRYGTAHIKARAAAALRHQPTDPCCRCRHPLGPMGPWLHYDHDEHDEHGGYLGFSHGWHPCPHCGKKCNIKAGAAKGNQRQRAKTGRVKRAQSRVW